MAGEGHNSGELTPAEWKALKFHHFRAITAQKAKLKVEQDEYKRLRKLAKADQIVLSDIDFMMKCADVEDETILTDRARREAEILAWFALAPGHQADMFGNDSAEPGEDKAARMGEADGYAGKDCSSPYGPNTAQTRAYDAAWRKAQDQMLADFQAASEKANARAEDEDEDPGFDEAA